MDEEHRILYMCEICFLISETPGVHHERLMIKCDAGCPGDDCTKPIADEGGHIVTHAPKWWVYRHAPARDHLANKQVI